MTKTVIFTGEITEKSVRNLIKELEVLTELKCLIQLYFSSPGGYYGPRQILDDFLSAHTDKIVLIGSGTLFSSGFLTFFNYTGEKRVLADCLAMIHQTTTTLDYRELHKSHSYSHIDRQLVDDLNAQDYNRFSSILTADEQTRYLSGGDVYISNARLQALC